MAPLKALEKTLRGFIVLKHIFTWIAKRLSWLGDNFLAHRKTRLNGLNPVPPKPPISWHSPTLPKNWKTKETQQRSKITPLRWLLLGRSAHLVVVETGELFQIVAGAKVSAEAVDDGNLGLVVGLELLESLAELRRGLLIKG